MVSRRTSQSAYGTTGGTTGGCERHQATKARHQTRELISTYLAWDILMEAPIKLGDETRCLKILEEIAIDFGWSDRVEIVRRYLST